MLDLAELDQRLDRLAHRRATLPEIAACAELTSRQVRVGDLLVAVQTEESDIGREQLKAEADVDAVRNRAVRDQQRLDNGSVTSAKELESLQSELTSLARRQGDLEDAVLEIMERRESAAARAEELAGERDSIAADLIRISGERDSALAGIDDEMSSLRGERDVLAGGLPVDLVTLYEKIRVSSDGVGAAALRRGRCEGCRVDMSTADLNKIKSAADDLVIRCEECRRILVRVPDSGL